MYEVNKIIFSNGNNCLIAFEIEGRAKLSKLNGWIEFYQLENMLTSNGYKIVG
jgi:hypothetical protein